MKKKITLLIVALLILQPFLTMLTYATAENDVQVLSNENENGLVTTIVSDEALYNALKTALSNKAIFDDETRTIKISKNEIENINTLILENKNISNLKGIEIFTELKELDLSSNKLDKNSNLNSLQALTKLHKLDLSTNKIEDISAIGSTLDIQGLEIDLQGQNLKVIEFMDIYKVETEDDAMEILNSKKQTLELAQIFSAYEGTEIEIEQLKNDEKKVNSENIKEYVSINKESNALEFPIKNVKKYEMNISIQADVPTNKTNATYKIYRIDKKSQTGIVFKDENLYNSVKKQLKETYGYTNWTYDDEDLIIIAEKSELDKVSNITVNRKAVKDLTGLEKFVGLKDLNLEDNSIIGLNTICELYANKKNRVEELKEKYNKLITELKEYLTNANKNKTEIERLEKEIEEIEKNLNNNTESNQQETIAEKQELIEKQRKALAEEINKTATIVNSIKEILSVNNATIGDLVNSPVAYEKMNELKEKIQENYTEDISEKSEAIKKSYLKEEIELLKNNELETIATSVSNSLNNLTLEEIEELIAATQNTEIEILTELDVKRVESKNAVTLINKYIDNLKKEGMEAFVGDFNSVFETEIKTTATVKINNKEEEKEKDISKLKTELKTALNNIYTAGNKDGANFEKILDFYTTYTYTEDIKKISKDEKIELFKTKLIEKYKELDKDIKNGIKDALKTDITADGKIMYENLRKDLNKQVEKLLSAYDGIDRIINTDKTYIDSTIEALGDQTQDDKILIASRMANVPAEDIDKLIKIPELERLNLNRNLITDTSKLAEVATIKELYLNNNLISEFDFSKFNNLEVLDLSSNCISDVSIEKMENIEALNLAKNRITNIDNINLEGLPKLELLLLDQNMISDIEKLLNSKNEVLTKAGYVDVADAIKNNAGIEISLASQSLEMNLKVNAKENSKSVAVELPKIFKQVKELQSEKVRVVFEKVIPCTNIYNDGTKADIDITEKNAQKVGLAIINMEELENQLSYFANGTTCSIKYIVEEEKEEQKDTTAPTIEIIKSTEEKTDKDVTITVIAEDNESGLAEKAYSFDGGKTWQKENTKVYSENTEEIIIKVRDAAGNIATAEKISITNIDKTTPEEPAESAEPKVTSSKFSVKEEEKVILGVTEKTKASELLAKLQVNEGTKLKVEEKQENDIVGTGTKVKATNGTKEVEYVVVVIGDINGDGEFGFEDACMAISHYNENSLTGLKLKAIDLNNDGEVSFDEVSMLIGMYLNKN